MTAKEVNLLQLGSVTRTKKEIGKGSYGRVFEATALCAIKEIHPILVNDCTPQEFSTLKKNYLKECSHSSQLCHPNIVQFLGIYYPSEDAKLPWLVMERMDCNLKQFLGTHQPYEVSFQVRMSILHDISLGLQYLHVHDIIHRDLSSNNILLTKQLVAKIGDLGVAKIIDPTGTKTATQVPGTVTFMPPEALSYSPTYGKPVDVFSLGCVMIHTMTHKWPFPKDETRIDKSSGKKSALSEVERREDYLALIQPKQLTDCIKQCLNDLPEKRPSVSDISVVYRGLQPHLQLTKMQSEHDQSQTSKTINELQKERDSLLQSYQKLSQEQGRLLHVDRQLTQANKDKNDLRKLLQQSLEKNQTTIEERQKVKGGKKDVVKQQREEQYMELLRIVHQDLVTKDAMIGKYKAECDKLYEELQKYKQRSSTSDGLFYCENVGHQSPTAQKPLPPPPIRPRQLSRQQLQSCHNEADSSNDFAQSQSHVKSGIKSTKKPDVKPKPQIRRRISQGGHQSTEIVTPDVNDVQYVCSEQNV
ncbi:probable serine/threonine-protein kinase kinX isoform X2 [Dysidea avara]|uniref:probable serine/threonine-protein kinase kinX isoform X2 n=1 Tax=Dysidea avara TaxID=196820 RepID=UPI00332B72DE